LGGGNFWQGAVTGLVVAGLNHVGHDEGDPIKKVKQNCKHSVIDDSNYAQAHYYCNNGKSVSLGKNTLNILKNSSEFKYVLNRLARGIAINTSSSFDVQMTTKIFHIGRTNVNYTTTCNDDTCVTKFTAFVNDGFWDPDFVLEHWPTSNVLPDGLGPNLELPGGRPYSYLPSEFSYSYPNKFPKPR
jgi:hypothetical protein